MFVQTQATSTHSHLVHPLAAIVRVASLPNLAWGVDPKLDNCGQHACYEYDSGSVKPCPLISVREQSDPGK